jgi:hypothetical protein
MSNSDGVPDKEKRPEVEEHPPLMAVRDGRSWNR